MHHGQGRSAPSARGRAPMQGSAEHASADGLYGSYGRRQNMFGRQGSLPRPEVIIDQPAFGRRTRAPRPHVSLQRERLRGLYAELWMVFSDPAYPANGVPVSFDDSEDPCIALGDEATISVDPESGSFLFRRHSLSGDGDIIITTDVDRLMDFVVAHLTRIDGAPQGGLAFVEKSVGRSIEDVERVLILSTLRHCQGNRTQTAKMLGISLRTLRNKLHSYWASLIAEGQAAAEHLQGDNTVTSR